MRKYNFYFSILTVLVIISVAVGFWLGGSPIALKALSADAKILSDFTTVKYQIDSYYQKSGSLPKSLEDLPEEAPYTSQPTSKIDYKATGDLSYSLCSTFMTDTRNQSSSYRDYQYTNVGGTTVYHNKGYDCVELSVYNYRTPAPVKEDNWITNQQLIVAYVSIVSKLEDENVIYVKDNISSQITKVIYVSGAKLLSLDGKELKIEDFSPDDKIVIDATANIKFYKFKASQIQNLSK